MQVHNLYIDIYRCILLESKEDKMKNYSRVLSWQSLENIDLLKLASEASQENFEKIVFLTTK